VGTLVRPNHHGRQLLRALTRLREQAGLTLAEAGTKLRFPEPKLSRIENGQVPGYHETFAMLRLYGLSADERTRYLTLWEQARKQGWWREVGLTDAGYVCLEQQATGMTEFQLGYVPELLQTERYARKCLENIDVRMRRQQRLLDDAPLILHTLVHEPVLHQGLDRDQLRQLIARARMPNVTLQIVPQSAGVHGGLAGSVILLDFDDPQEPDYAFAETALGTTRTHDKSQTMLVRDMLQDVASLALTPEASVDLMRSLLAPTAVRVS
jgi:transcriptional regulator with XRE-family HTH domain